MSLDWNYLDLRFLPTVVERAKGVCCWGDCRHEPVVEIDSPLGRTTYCPLHATMAAESALAYATAEGERIVGARRYDPPQTDDGIPF